MVIWPGAILSTPRTKSNMRPAVRQAKAAEICSAYHAGRPHPALWGAGEYKSRPALPAVPHANVPFVLLDKASPALPFSTLQAGERKPCLPIVFKARLGISRWAFCCVSPYRPRGLGNPSRALLGRNEAKHPALLWCKPKDLLWMALFFHSPPIFELHMQICAEQKIDDQNENIKANNRQVKDAESILPYRSK